MSFDGLVLNRRTGKIHKRPTREQCNVDAIPKKYRVRGEAIRDFGRKWCKHCFGGKALLSKGYALYDGS